jgi:hypothetical protein
VQGTYGRLSYPELLSQYGRAFLASPAIIVQDKLQMSNLTWNLVAGAVYRWPDDDDDVALVQARQVNGLTKFWRWIDARGGPLVKILLWRVGGWTLVLAVVGWYWWQRGKKWWLLALLPVWGNLWSLWLVMPAQDYRYVWYVTVVAMFLPLINLTDEAQVDGDGDQLAKDHHPS